MYKLKLRIIYTNKNENTDINILVNVDKSEQQNDQGLKGKLGLVLDYFPLVVRLLSVAPVILDAISKMI